MSVARLNVQVFHEEVSVDNRSTSSEPDLVGSWRKAEAPLCAARYPDLLTFSAGTYRGTRGPAQGFVYWDAGIYRVEEKGRLSISVATDELLAYEIRLEDDVLAVVDPDGCRFSYRRIPEAGQEQAERG